MPKLKTRRAAAKRFKATGSGKLKRKKANLRHILTTKDPKRKKHLRAGTYVSSVDELRVKRDLPYL